MKDDQQLIREVMSLKKDAERIQIEQNRFEGELSALMKSLPKEHKVSNLEEAEQERKKVKSGIQRIRDIVEEKVEELRKSIERYEKEDR